MGLPVWKWLNHRPIHHYGNAGFVSPEYNFGYLLDGSAGSNLNYRITSAKVTSDRIIWTALNADDEPSINIYTLNSDYTIGSLLYSHSSSGTSIGYWGSPALIVQCTTLF